ncbi:MAG: DegT/DnrJ/EryC1/StrS family aminotransferase [Flammeovirgaceae bacterium]|nr:DegT/DnrJ/EryC1/StrS family aminotransferase [Flammeovirgaceae bacterium]
MKLEYKNIPVNEPLLDGNEKKYLNQCIDTGWISSEGPFIKEFEEKMAKQVGRKYGIAVSNGSVAIDAAILALGIGKNDEVIMPTFTIISCAAAIVRVGAKPVLVDCNADDWNMNVTQIESKISAKTKAIMVVHIYGLPVDMNAIIAVAEKHGLMIIEDAAEQHGQYYGGKPIGCFGDISTFSFYPNKHITTGEGGMIVTNDERLADKCRLLRNLCFIPEKRFLHHELGFNLRMTNLQAALGLAQLERLDEFISINRKMGKKYSSILKTVAGITLPLDRNNDAENIYWVYPIVLNDSISFDAEVAMKKLGERKIGTRPFFWPMHEQPVFHKMGLFVGEKYPVAERAARRGLYLPSGMALKTEDIDIVCDAVKEILM